MNKCHRCVKNGPMRVFAMLAIMIFAGIFVIGTLRALLWFSRRAYLGVTMKIFVGYVQSMAWICMLRLDWNDSLREFFEVQQYFGPISFHFFDFDCLFSTDGHLPVVFQKLAVLVFIPLVIPMIASLSWRIVKARKLVVDFRSKYVGSVITLFGIFQPFLVYYMAEMLNCHELDDGKMYLRMDYSVQCWAGDHGGWVAPVAVLSLLIWALFVPCWFATALYINKSSLIEKTTRFKYGYLIVGYKETRWFWELFILGRKLALVFLVVFLNDLHPAGQARLIFLVLFLALYLQIKLEPFVLARQNSLEANSLLTLLANVFFGMYFVDDSTNRSGESFVTTLIICLNAAFFLQWTSEMRQLLADYLMVKRPKIYRKLCLCTEKARKRYKSPKKGRTLGDETPDIDPYVSLNSLRSDTSTLRFPAAKRNKFVTPVFVSLLHATGLRRSLRKKSKSIQRFTPIQEDFVKEARCSILPRHSAENLLQAFDDDKNVRGTRPRASTRYEIEEAINFLHKPIEKSHTDLNSESERSPKKGDKDVRNEENRREKLDKHVGSHNNIEKELSEFEHSHTKENTHD